MSKGTCLYYRFRILIHAIGNNVAVSVNTKEREEQEWGAGQLQPRPPGSCPRGRHAGTDLGEIREQTP